MAKEYIYRAALYCEYCIEKIKKSLGYSHEGMSEYEYDSDEYPKGGLESSESDSPQHCDACGEFLYNPLTGDGYKYIKRLAKEDPTSEFVQLWVEYYDIELEI